jgi:hypothetical protein
MPVWYAVNEDGRLRKELYRFHLLNWDLRTCFRNLRRIIRAWHS